MILISRLVLDRSTNKHFRQLQVIGQRSIDPDRSAAVGYCSDEIWDKEVAPTLSLMSPNPTTPVPTEALPVVYEFIWLVDQPELSGEWPNGRPKRAHKPKPEPPAAEVAIQLDVSRLPFLEISLSFANQFY